jgi:large subunit ribosomal protein L7/L12
MSKKVDTIIDQLKELTLIEASELVKAIEDTFDVSAAAPVASAAVAVAGPAAPAAEEQTEFKVELAEVPADKKIAAIKAVKNLLGIGLSDAKAKVESAPVILAEGLSKEDAAKYKEELTAAGSTVNLK